MMFYSLGDIYKDAPAGCFVAQENVNYFNSNYTNTACISHVIYIQNHPSVFI